MSDDIGIYIVAVGIFLLIRRESLTNLLQSQIPVFYYYSHDDKINQLYKSIFFSMGCIGE